MHPALDIFASLPTLTHSTWPRRPNISVIRGDLLHPVVSGNKLYKLQPQIKSALQNGQRTLVSVGGRYSNHLHALAWACRAAGLESVGLVLGYPAQALTPTLIDCQNWGMRLHFVDRKAYQGRYDDAFWPEWMALYPNSMRVNEGAWSTESIAGSALWWHGIAADTERVICPVGSGCTLAGLAMNAPPGIQVVGVPVFKDANNYRDLHAKLAGMGLASTQYRLWTDFAGPGFGKLSLAQRDFSRTFTETTGIALDPVYTAKAFYALAAQLEIDPDLSGQNIAILHTGGLQGCRE